MNIDKIVQFLETPALVEKLSKVTPEKNTVVFNTYDLFEFSEELFNTVTGNMDECVEKITEYVRDQTQVSSAVVAFDTKVMDETPIRLLSGHILNKLIRVSGIATSSVSKDVVLTVATYRCDKCGSEVNIKVDGQFILPPNKCEECDDGRMVIDPMKGRNKTVQWILLQEKQENMKTGAAPQSVKVMLEETLVDRVNPGDRITVSGYLKALRRKPSDPTPIITIYLQASMIEKENQAVSDVSVSSEDIVKMREIVANPDYVKTLIRSIAPGLYGLEREKISMALQQVGGSVVVVEGDRRRGSIHILLAGDPGEGKSKLLEWGVKINPRAIKTVGTGTTAAGLTAATIRDEETGQYVLVAGAMILADGGLVAADEFDKMRKEDRNSMHSAMEDQVVAINKGGFNTVMNSRCSVLAACNPSGGNWNPAYTLIENVKGFPPALISRFDLIWVLTNTRTVEDEMKRVDHILKGRFHQGEIKSEIGEETVKKIFAYARTITPVIGAECEAKIRGFYEEVLTASKKTNRSMLTMRQLEGLSRLTEASAKLHLREVAVAADAELAISLVRESLSTAGVDPSTGQVDSSVSETGVPSSLSDQLMKLPKLIKELEKSSVDGTVRREDLVGRMVIDWKIDRSRVSKILTASLRDGTIIEPMPGMVKCIV